MVAKQIEGSIDINDNSFDIIRAFCTYIVFFGHFITHFEVESPVLIFIAYIVRAVPVFFLFSGFFTASSIERYSAKEFYVRRFFRIYPAMWLCIIINTIIILITYSSFPTFKDFLIYVGSQFTVGQFYTGDWLRGYGVGVPNGALWTISSDIQFYIIAIFIAKIMKNKSLKVWIITIGSFAMISLGLGQCEVLIPDIIYKIIMVVIVPYMYIFLFGMMVYYHKDKIIPFLANKWILISGIYITWSFMPNNITKYFQGVRYNIITTLLLMCLVISLGYAFGKHRSKNDYTYGFYLYHMVVINFIYHMFIKKIDQTWMFIILLIISSLVIFTMGFLSQKFVDKKISNSLQRKVLNSINRKQSEQIL